MPRRPTSQLLMMIALPLLVLSAGVNVLQAQRIRSLMDATKAPASSVGKSIDSISGFALGGEARTLSLRAPIPTLVYYFSPTCTWCERNWMNVAALRDGARGRFRVILVSSSRALREYVLSHQLDLEVIEGIGDNTRTSLGLVATPQTVVVAPTGLVTHDWRGAYTPRMERQIEELFDISLPGLLPGPTSPAKATSIK